MFSAENRSNWMIFFTSFALFAFLLLASPIVSTILAGVNLEILHAAPLIGSALAAFVIFKVTSRYKTILQQNIFNLLTLFSIPMALLFFKLIQVVIDRAILNSNPSSQQQYMTALLEKVDFNYKLWLMLGTALPFFFYGLFVSLSFELQKKDKILKFYSSELLGMVAGYCAAVLVLDLFSFQLLLALIFLVSALSCFISDKKFGIATGLILLSLSLFAYINPDQFEPQRKHEWLLRDFDDRRKPTETRKDWTTFTKVQTFEVIGLNDLFYRTVVIGEGLGHAYIPSYDETKSYYRIPEIAAAAVKPKNILILFAGAGADMVLLQELLQYPVNIVGVEINRRVIEHGLEARNSKLKSFLENNKDRVQLINSDSRKYLETTDKKFDTILFSWSGASYAHYSGAIVHTSQYAFTKEALEKAYSLLNPDGHLIILGGIKLKVFLAFIKIFEENKLGTFLNSSLVAMRPDSKSQWKQNWDDYVLYVKKGIYKIEEVQEIDSYLKPYGYSVEVSAFNPGDEQTRGLLKIASSSDSQDALNNLSEIGLKNYYHDTDNTPFAYRTSLFAVSDLRLFLQQYIESIKKGQFFTERINLIFLLLIFFIFLSFQAKSKTYTNSGFVLIAGLTGAVTNSLFILSVYKSLLFVGNPSYAILFSQFINLASSAAITFVLYKKSNVLSLFAKNVFLIFILSVGGIIAINSASSFSLLFTNYGLLLYGAVLMLTTTCGAFLFARLLENAKFENNSQPSLFYAANLTGGGIAAILTPLIIESRGLQFSYMTSLSLIFAVLFLTMKFRIFLNNTKT